MAARRLEARGAMIHNWGMRRGDGWWRAAVAAGLVALAALLAVTAVPLWGAADRLQTSANVAQLASLLLAVAIAAATLVGRALHATRARRARSAPASDVVTRAKDVLAGVMTRQWRDEAAIRSLGDPDPIAVRWRLTGRTGLMDHPGNIETSIAAITGRMRWQVTSADVAGLAERFRATRRRRLVIAGGPGTGKTTLAVQLLLHLLRTRTEDEPVPALFPLAGWDTGAFPRLHDWLVDRLLADYPALRSPGLGREVVRALAARGQILPVLDGLDELPAAARADVITALNRSLGDDDQLILTSRTKEYAKAVAAAGRVLTSAAVLEPTPLSPGTAADYLDRCLPPRPPGSPWEPVLTALRATRTGPGGRPAGGPAAAVAAVATTPLGLWLLRTVYTAPGADPASLTDRDRFPDAAALRTHLFDELIPAVIATRRPGTDPDGPAEPFRPRRAHEPERVRRWLGYLADRLTHPRAADRTPRTHDLAWWRLARETLTVAPRMGVAGNFTWAMLLGFGTVLVAGTAVRGAPGPAAIPAIALVAVAVFAVAGWGAIAFWSRDTPGYVELRLRKPLSRLGTAVPTGLGFGIAAGLCAREIFGAGAAVPFGIAGALATGLVDWAESPTPEGRASTPTANWRADRALNVTRLAVSAVAFGVAGLVAAGPGGDPVHAIVMGLVALATFGLAFGVIALGHHSWLAYVAATGWLALRGRLPRRLMPFLDDAHRLGLLRAVGPVYQFRHAEFQDHLATRSDASGRERARLPAR